MTGGKRVRWVAAVLTPGWVCMALAAGAKSGVRQRERITTMLDATTPPACPFGHVRYVPRQTEALAVELAWAS